MKGFGRFKTLPQRSKWRIVVRYALYQVPDMAILVLILIVIQQWVSLPSWLTWGLVLLWVGKDVIMFPFTWYAYDRSSPRDGRSLIGEEGIAEERLAPSGYIRVHGELWQAEVMGKGAPIEKGGKVQVQELNGLTLLVQANPKE